MYFGRMEIAPDQLTLKPWKIYRFCVIPELGGISSVIFVSLVF